MDGPARNSLMIAAVQPACVPYDVEENACTHSECVRAADASVVVFPELSLTGYELDAPVVASDDARLAPIIAACGETETLALVGAPVRVDAHDYIAVFAIDTTGARVAYRKMWLSNEESERFTPGDKPTVVVRDGWRLGLAICKDTGVEQHASDTAALGIDAYVAGVLDSANDATIQDERARRIAADHRVWVVVASFAGSTGGGYLQTAADSRIWSPDGVVVARAGAATGGIARAQLTRSCS